MQLTLTDDQQAIVDLAQQILGDRCPPEHLQAIEDGDGEDATLHGVVAGAGLLGLAQPEADGGGGLGLLEAALVAEVAGAHAAPVPLVDAVASGRALRGDSLAAAVAAGTAIVRVALREGPDASEHRVPASTAEERDGATVLAGRKHAVGGPLATHYLVSASDGGRVGLYLVDADAVGREASFTSTGAPVYDIELAGTPARRVGDAEAVDALVRDLTVLRCANQAGVVRAALDLAAAYCSQREQFGAKIGTFQAVAHRLADAWIDANAVQMTARQAAWRIDHSLPSAQAVASAAFWACEGAHRVVHSAQHVHGGIGVDTDYPVHRFFRWAKANELALGSGSRALVALGDAIAAEPLTIG